MIARWTQRREWEKKYAAMISQIENMPAQRIKCHVKYLDEYWLRWLGFCRLETIAPRSLINNQLFLVVEAASKIAGKELKSLSVVSQNNLALNAWNKYQASVSVLRKCPTNAIKENAELAYLDFKTFAEIKFG